MIAVKAFLMGLGGRYIAQPIEGEMSTPATLAFAIAIIFLSQAPVVALHARVRKIESRAGYSSPADND